MRNGKERDLQKLRKKPGISGKEKGKKKRKTERKTDKRETGKNRAN